jgi:hypothetical protein
MLSLLQVLLSLAPVLLPTLLQPLDLTLLDVDVLPAQLHTQLTAVA